MSSAPGPDTPRSAENDWRTPLPPQAFLLGRVIHPIHRLFDWLYHSRYNPLYRSGTLAIGFLVVLVITGVYLLCFYSVSSPYESVERIQAQAYFGRWMRAVHRYATIGALLSVLFHILQLLLQGKTWGPRLLAWLSGVVLTLFLYLCAWTGYVMVWDAHGQWVALSGASMLAVIPFLRDILTSAFDGQNPVTSAFFFMNLFLHIMIPVGLIFGLWVHTAKISRSRWFPLRPIFLWSSVGLVALGAVWPAELLKKADLFQLPSRMPVDVVSGFWLPLALSSPTGALFLWSALVLGLVALPWWWRPPREKVRLASVVDRERCTGCTQCARDCPYEAIVMVPRDDGRRLVAEVREGSCVSCGICAASCGDICVGPPGRSGVEQVTEIERFLDSAFPQPAPYDVVVIVCKHNGAVPAAWRRFAEIERGYHLFFADCCGTIHTQAMERLLDRAGGLFFHACPERNCFNRDGLDLLTQRIFSKRVPFLARDVDRRRLVVDASSERELEGAFRAAREFASLLPRLSLGASGLRSAAPGRALVVRRAAASVIILLALGALSRVPLGEAPHDAVLRIGGRLPAETSSACRPLTEGEKRSLPLHMQRPQICESRPGVYRLLVRIDGAAVLERELRAHTLRGDGMIFVSEDVRVESGTREFEVILEGGDTEKSKIRLHDRTKFDAGRIYLLTYDALAHKFSPRWISDGALRQGDERVPLADSHDAERREVEHPVAFE